MQTSGVYSQICFGYSFLIGTGLECFEHYQLRYFLLWRLYCLRSASHSRFLHRRLRKIRDTNVRGGFVDSFQQDFGCIGQFHDKEFLRHTVRFFLSGFLAFLSLNRSQHRSHIFPFATADLIEDITVEVEHTALPPGLWIHFWKALHKTRGLVRDHQVNPNCVSGKSRPCTHTHNDGSMASDANPLYDHRSSY